jgi:hypothetical protein
MLGCKFVGVSVSRKAGRTPSFRGARYLLWTLRFSSSKELRFEDQIETFTHFF